MFIQEARPMSHARSPRELVEESPPLVLVVDDNDDLREMIVALLEDHGFRTAAATNGAEAVSWLSRGLRPALIVLDLMMPVMDGWETLKWLKGERELSTIPVVIVSAGTDHPASATYFLKKPFDCDVLIQILRSCLAEVLTAG
jgi:CheY-like chemotaxis protein